MRRISALLVLLISIVSFAQTAPTPTRKPGPKATPAEAEKFVADAEKQIFELGLKAQRASWVHENFITDDTEAMASEAGDALTELGTRLAKEAVRFDELKLPYDTARKLKLIKLALTIPSP